MQIVYARWRSWPSSIAASSVAFHSSVYSSPFFSFRYHIPATLPPSAQRQVLKKLNLDDLSVLCHDPRVYTKSLTNADRSKQTRVMDAVHKAKTEKDREAYLAMAVERLTPDDVR